MIGEKAKLYPEHRLHTLEPHYSRHVSGMTEYGLHNKSDIAEQLAWRDQCIDALRSRIAQLEAVVEAQVLVVASADILRKRLEDGHARRVYSQLYDAHRAKLGAPGQLARHDDTAKAEKESKDG